jgi:A/G-specific adenine glycosylase
VSDARRDAAVARALCRWFAEAARPLPWRVNRGGYAALVSEAMLQQTQVSRVLDSYPAFMRRFSTVAALAAADEQDVLAHWHGLGYYRRARNLHAAAQMIVRDFGGRVPRSVENLRRLPGIGRYTAGAIASIVFGQREPIVDANARRVLLRIDGKPLAGAAAERWAWQRAQELVDASPDPAAINEAMMEFGSTICLPRSPRCKNCPVSRHCIAQQRGLQAAIPRPKTPPPRKRVHHHAVIIRRNGQILLEQRPTNGLWAGMWQTPTVECDQPLDEPAIRSRLPVRVTNMGQVSTFEHHISGRRIVFHVHTARTRARRGVWRSPGELDGLPMSAAQRRIITMA